MAHRPSSTIRHADCGGLKVTLRGEANNIAVREIRIVRKNDVLGPGRPGQHGPQRPHRVHRFKWLDNVGNQVGDGESWKQLGVLGLGQQTIKSGCPAARPPISGLK